MGRFINKDPIEEQGGLNLYGFCRNNAINKWDYLGMVEVPDWWEGSEADYNDYVNLQNAVDAREGSDGSLNWLMSGYDNPLSIGSADAFRAQGRAHADYLDQVAFARQDQAALAAAQKILDSGQIVRVQDASGQVYVFLPGSASSNVPNSRTLWGGAGDGATNDFSASGTATSNSNVLVIYNSNAIKTSLDGASGKDFRTAAYKIDATARVDASSLAKARDALPTLSGYGKFDVVYVIEHGLPGNQKFGSIFGGISPTSAAWDTMAGAVRPGGRVCLLGCEVGAGGEGFDYVNALRGDRNIYVGANQNDTGYYLPEDGGGIRWETVKYQWGSKGPKK